MSEDACSVGSRPGSVGRNGSKDEKWHSSVREIERFDGQDLKEAIPGFRNRFSLPFLYTALERDFVKDGIH